ncbi:MAG: helix-hairpin-helix domain-containing protein, partial [Bacteroidales bacterium]|nr:helix-hairpin-helix domain-containing protein [Bacteroidales bacterium]
MWKDFFYFSKSERRAVIALTFLIVIVQVALWTTDYWLPLLPEKITKIAVIDQSLSGFRDSLAAPNKADRSFPRSSDKLSGQKYAAPAAPVVLAPFDPNTADSSVFVSLGLRSYIARNILKYRRKGGVFRKAEDFARIYGIEPAQYAELKPYIRINPDHAGKTDLPGNHMAEENHFSTKQEREYSLDSEKDQKGQSGSDFSVPLSEKTSGTSILEINQVDTVVLQQLKGVGVVTANKVVQYRNRLGGFYSVRQLEEIKGIYPEVLLRLQSLLKVDTAQIRKINANKASLERLKSHPYLSFY